MAENRGGKRTGELARPYPNRTDMNEPPKGMEYGKRQEMEKIAGSVPNSPQAPRMPEDVESPGIPAPGSIPQLGDPSMMPDDPLTSGLKSGPGLGPEAMHVYNHGDEELSILRMIYQQFPSDDLRRLIEWQESNS